MLLAWTHMTEAENGEDKLLQGNAGNRQTHSNPAYKDVLTNLASALTADRTYSKVGLLLRLAVCMSP